MLISVIPSLLSTSQILWQFSQVYNRLYIFLVGYINYLKIFLKKECFVMKTVLIWKIFYKENEKEVGPGSVLVFLEHLHPET